MSTDFSQELNAEQLAVIRHGDGPCVVLAGAGSGKTRTIVYRVASLIDRGVAPESILLLTFTNKAASEMMDRIHALIGDSPFLPQKGQSPWGGTFHSIANRILRSFATHVGYQPNFTILDEEDSRDLMKSAMRDVGIDLTGKRFPSPAVMRQFASYGTNAMIGLEAAVQKLHPKFEPLYVDIARAANRYAAKKREANAMDFDDLLAKFHELLSTDAPTRQLLQAKFRYILVDEYQDTNALQSALVGLLAGPDGNVTAVGDDAQSIYSFRAADVRNILDFPKLFPKAAIYRLETNYRSVPEILDLANDVISRNVRQFPKELKSVLPRHVRPAVKIAPSANREADLVADRIQQLLSDGVPPREIAVLFRAAHHSQALEFELMRRGVEFDYRGGVRFFERAHVKDALAHLRLAANIHDEAAWLRVLRLQQGIGEATADRMFALLSVTGSLAHAVLAPVEERCGSRTARGWKELRGALESMLRAKGDPAALVRAVIDSSYSDYLEAEYTDAADRLEDLEQLAVFAANYKEVPDFLADVTLDDRLHRSPNGDQRLSRVVLSTVHQAKGLEWEAVFLIHLNDGAFPNRRAMFEDGGLEEERRLFYVAVTRAKRHLMLSYPLTAGYDASALQGPSIFLQEADPNCFERERDDDVPAFGGFSRRSAGGSPFADDWGGDFASDEPTVERSADGEPLSPLEAVKSRMGKVRGDWKKKSFLGDV